MNGLHRGTRPSTLGPASGHGVYATFERPSGTKFGERLLEYDFVAVSSRTEILCRLWWVDITVSPSGPSAYISLLKNRKNPMRALRQRVWTVLVGTSASAVPL